MALWRDETPPAQPVHLAGLVDTTGIVSLVWKWGEEVDLLGYRVYWSNAPNREFYQLTNKPVKGSVFLDSISMRTTSEKVYYKVVAVDFNMNPSKPSKILEIQRPDRIAPMSPLLSNYQAFSDSIQLTWQPSPSKDVVAHRLLRKEQGQPKYQVLTTIVDSEQTSFTDQTVERGKTYEYAMTAIDDANLYAPISRPFILTALNGKKRKRIVDLSGQVDESDGTFQLTWTYRSTGNFKFLVLRNAHDDKGWQVEATLPGNQFNYRDQQLYRSPNGFRYALKVVYADGGESPLSNEVQLNINP